MPRRKQNEAVAEPEQQIVAEKGRRTRGAKSEAGAEAAAVSEQQSHVEQSAPEQPTETRPPHVKKERAPCKERKPPRARRPSNRRVSRPAREQVSRTRGGSPPEPRQTPARRVARLRG